MGSEALPPDVRQVLASGLDGPADADSRDLSSELARAFGASTVAVLHYGSRAQGRKPRADSAFDFFVIVDDYRQAYTSLAATVGTSYSASLATRLARRLPPNVIAVSRGKVCVLSCAHFLQACSDRARDHFTHGRLMQVVRLTWARDAGAADMVAGAIASVRAHTFAWGRPSLPARFTVDDYLYTILRRSLAGEIRPETGDHARTLLAPQEDELRPVYAALLDQLAAEGALAVEEGGAYRLTSPPGWWERTRVGWYFRRSKLRATVRLLKHVALYEGWLEYIVRKVERSGNAPVVLTDRERRWPLIFLWPRVIRFVVTRPQRRQ